MNLRDALAKVWLELAAEGHWAVWFNGVLLQTGQDRSPASMLYTDKIPLPGIKRSGRCYLGLALHWNGRRNYQGQPVRPGFCARVVDARGNELAIPDWRLKKADEFECRGWLYTFQSGYSEFQDLRKEDAEWWRGKGNGWVTPMNLPWRRAFPHRQMIARRASVLLQPGPRGHMIFSGAVPPQQQAEEMPPGQAMLTEPHLQAARGVFKNGSDAEPIRIVPADGCRDVFLIYDLEKQTLGHLQVEITAEGGLLDVATNEACAGNRLFTALKREGIAADRQYNFADRFRLRKGRQTAALSTRAI